MEKYEDKIYSLGEAVTGQTQAMSQAVQKTLENNGGVGIMTGSYDQNLSILSVNNLLLHSTGYTFDTFMEQTKGSLRNFFYDEEDILERDRFLQLHGTGEAQILAADGTVNNVRLCKEDATDEALNEVIELYSNTSGIRDLEQAAEHIAANALYQIEVNHVEKVEFDAEMVRELLG